MRDLVLFAVIFGGLPFILRFPSVGVFYWVWLSLMNPHRLAWGLAYAFPFAQVIAIATLLGLLFTRDPRQFKGGAATITLFCFVVFVCFTTIFALVPGQATPMLERILKIQLLTFVALLVLNTKDHVIWLVWVVAGSIGFFAIKGGAFTLATLGVYRVYGPAESYIAENNALALATIMSVPLWAFLFTHYRERWWRWGFIAAILLSAASALGSQSRGALVAIAAMTLFLWLKARRKLLIGTGLAIAGVALIGFMPSSWEERMGTIAEYEQDASAQGRLNTWIMMFRIAVDRPFTGGGLEPYSESVRGRYLPEYPTVHSAHSVYFQVLGEHGFIGLSLFLLFWVLTWRIARWIIRESDGHPDLAWSLWLARMIQVSLIAYFVGGAFLNLAYWDMPYYLMIMLAVTQHVVRSSSSVGASAAVAPSTQTASEAAALPRSR